MKFSEKEINLTRIYNHNNVTDNFGAESSFNRLRNQGNMNVNSWPKKPFFLGYACVSFELPQLYR